MYKNEINLYNYYKWQFERGKNEDERKNGNGLTDTRSPHFKARSRK